MVLIKRGKWKEVIRQGPRSGQHREQTVAPGGENVTATVAPQRVLNHVKKNLEVEGNTCLWQDKPAAEHIPRKVKKKSI